MEPMRATTANVYAGRGSVLQGQPAPVRGCGAALRDQLNKQTMQMRLLMSDTHRRAMVDTRSTGPVWIDSLRKQLRYLTLVAICPNR